MGHHLVAIVDSPFQISTMAMFNGGSSSIPGGAVFDPRPRSKVGATPLLQGFKMGLGKAWGVNWSERQNLIIIIIGYYWYNDDDDS